MWLHPMPMRPCLDVTTWDASSDAGLLRAYPSLFRFVRCYAYHACLHHPLAFYAFLQAWLYVHAWVLLATVSFMLEHNEVMDIRSKLTFVPRGHHLFVCLFACLFSFLFAYVTVCLLDFRFVYLSCGLSRLLSYAMLSMSIMLIYFMPFPRALCIFFFPLLVYWFLVFAFACTHMEWGHMELGHGLPSAIKKGKDVNVWI